MVNVQDEDWCSVLRTLTKDNQDNAFWYLFCVGDEDRRPCCLPLASHVSLIGNIHIPLRDPLSNDSKKEVNIWRTSKWLAYSLKTFTHTVHVHSQKYAHIPIIFFFKKEEWMERLLSNSQHLIPMQKMCSSYQHPHGIPQPTLNIVHGN